MNRVVGLLLLIGLLACTAHAEQEIKIHVKEDILATVGPDFYGLHYDGPEHKTWDEVHKKQIMMPGMFGAPSPRRALQAIGTRVARIFVRCQDIHPQPDVLEWDFLDAAVGQVIDSDMTPMLCLHQGEGKWFVGTKESPWWQHEEAKSAWNNFVRACATRYGDRVRYYEVLNEPNLMKKEQDYYMGWERSVDCFIQTAQIVKRVDTDALCGGAATWAAWESATWAGHVLDRPEGERLLDFVSYHIYTSHDLKDSDASILSKVGWFEESPGYIQRELAERTKKRILTALTEFNASAIWSKEGKAYTDPRNVSALGGLVSSLAYLHSARGGCDMAMHFATAGGFGLLVWPPRYERQPAYYAVLLLHDVAGLVPGAELLATTTTQEAMEIPSAVRDKRTAYDLEPFAIRSDNHLSVVLVNKRKDVTLRAKVHAGPGALAQPAQLFRYSSTRIPDALFPLASTDWDSAHSVVDCPPYSVNVLRFAVAQPGE